MRTLPLIFQTSEYKYTIIARLATLPGAESKLKQRRVELVNYLSRQGYAETSINRWLTIKINESPEMPGALLLIVLDWLNRKYADLSQTGQVKINIHLEDLFHPEYKNLKKIGSSSNRVTGKPKDKIAEKS